jgi:molybdate transport system substrate-binding protein
MNGRRPVRRAPRTATVHPVLHVLHVLPVLVVLLGGLASCSDKHTEEEQLRSDNAVDPAVLAVLAPVEQQALVDKLVAAYGVHTGEAVILPVYAPAAQLPASMSSNDIPGLYIDAAPAAEVYAEELGAEAGPVSFAVDRMRLVVRNGNPDDVVDLTVFDGEDRPAVGGLCKVGTLCGDVARIVLDKAGVEPVPDREAEGGAVLAFDVARGAADAGLVFESEALAEDARLEEVDVPGLQQVTFAVVRFSSTPTAQAFFEWLTTSDEAASVIASSGMEPLDRGDG